MALQFILGGAGSGKTRYLYETAIRESMEHPDTQYLVVVPEQFTMQTQKEIIRLHPRHGVMNIDILSFKRLAYRVFEDLGISLSRGAGRHGQVHGHPQGGWHETFKSWVCTAIIWNSPVLSTS